VFILRQSEIWPPIDAFGMALAAYCLAWLLPHFTGLKNAASPQRRLAALAREALTALAASADPEDAVNESEDIAYASHEARDYKTLAAAQAELARVLGGSACAETSLTDMRRRLGAWCSFVHDDLRAAAVTARAIASEDVHTCAGELAKEEGTGLADTQLKLLGVLADPDGRSRHHSGLIIAVIHSYGSLARTALRRSDKVTRKRALDKMRDVARRWSTSSRGVYPLACAEEGLAMLRALAESTSAEDATALRDELASDLVHDCGQYASTDPEGGLDQRGQEHVRSSIVKKVKSISPEAFAKMNSVASASDRHRWLTREPL